MSTATTDLRPQTGVEIDTSLLAALDEVQDAAPARGRADGWVPPTQRRLSSSPPLATSLPIRGAGDTAVAEAAPVTTYRPSRSRTTTSAPTADPVAVIDVTYEQVRAEGLEWLRDLARRKA